VRKLLRGKEGAQLAELDILVNGRLGSTELRWLIECRDRPSKGPAPAEWITQLVGRRMVHKFNQVTAVSTTGFSAGALEIATTEGIETRTVTEVKPSDVESWLLVREVNLRSVNCLLMNAGLVLPKSAPDEIKAAATAKFTGMKLGDLRLFANKTAQNVPIGEAFKNAVTMHSEIIDQAPANDPEGKHVRLQVAYSNDADCYLLETDAGPVRVKEIHFEGRVVVTEKVVPLAALTEYKRDSGAIIAQSAVFQPMAFLDEKQYSLQIHNLRESGDTYLVLRRHTE
jgi:hypothetical protein